MNSIFGRYSVSSEFDPTALGLSGFSAPYAQYLKMTRVPRPAKTWVMVDEQLDSINDGLFIVMPNSTAWADIPGSNHNGGAGLGFADGHAEIKQWLSTTSKLPVRFAFYQVAFDPAGRADFQWLLERTGLINGNSGRPAFGY